MRLFGVMGYPVGHSASPAMMNRAFQQAGIDAVYTSFPVTPERVRTAFDGLAALGAAGVNVTIPHKLFAYEWVDELTEEARQVGAVNTVKFDEQGTIGHNTDVGGWWRSIEEHVTEHPRVAIVGAGGAARAIVSAISSHRPQAQLAVIARRSEAVEDLQRNVRNSISLKHIPWDVRAHGIADAEIVIQTTPIGMWPHDKDTVVDDASVFSAGQVVQDIIYRPQETTFLQMAQAQGATVIGGVPMLVYQGVLAYEWWLEQTAPVSLMFEAVEDFLAAEQQHV